MTRRPLCQTLLLAAFALSAGAGPAAAGEWIYWIRDGEIGRTAVDGSADEAILTGSSTITSIVYDPEAQQIFWGDMDTGHLWRGEALGGERNLLVESRGMPTELELSAGWLFWIDREYGVRRLARAGGEPETILGRERYDGAVALAVAGERLYWTDSRDAWLRRAGLDGSGVEKLVELDRKSVDEFEIDGGRVFWKGDIGKSLQRVGLDGSDRRRLVDFEERLSIQTFEIFDGALYWTVNLGPFGSAIERANLDGERLGLLDLPNLGEPFLGLAVAGGRVYWSEAHTGELFSAGLDGKDPRLHMTSFVADASGIVVLGDSIYWSQEALGFSRPGLIRSCDREGAGVVRDLVLVSERREPTALVTLGGRLFWIERSWLSGTTSRLVGVDPKADYPEESVVVDGIENPSGLAAFDGWLYWLEAGGKIRRVRPDGSGAQKVRSLPAEYRDEEQRYEALAFDGKTFYVGEARQDAVYRTRGRAGRETLANDLYLNHLFAAAGHLYWSGSEGLGRIELGSTTLETLSDRRLVEAIFVAAEPAAGDG